MLTLPPELAALNIQPPMSVDYGFQRMVVTDDGQCYPLLSLKGYKLYNTYVRNMLAAGSRKSGKTLAVGNRVVRHLWETAGAVVAVIAKTTKNAKIGVWRDLKNFILPGWANADFGFKIVDQGTDPATKMEYIKVTNMHGGVSEIQLHSLDYEYDVEEKFKSSRFSLIWLSEADQFKDRIVYDILEDQLRIIGLPFEAHIFVFDCNPPEEGEDHWLHDLFYKARNEQSKFYRKNFNAQFVSFEFGLDDNPFLDPNERQNLLDKYRHDPVKFARFCEGKWVRDTATGWFDDTFNFATHVKGSALGLDRSKWEIITPHKNARVLITGTDTGDLNHATSFICPRVDSRDENCYDVFDEICSIDKMVSIRTFAKEVWVRVQFWQEWMMKTYGLREAPHWMHWADSSLWEYSATANNNDAAIFWEVSDKNIGLRPVVKGAGSIKQRIGMTKRLFFDNRLNISAHCHWNIAWARFLKPGRAKNQPISESSKPFNHSFCATSYALGATIPHELQQDDEPSVATGIVTT